MEPVTRPDGVTFIRDDVKAPLWSLRPAFEFMGSASASRKIIVLGTISDYARGSYQAYRDVAKRALEVADLVLFVGPKASKSQRAKTHPKGDALLAFTSVEAASKYLGGVLRAGDLVLLKGSGVTDDLGRLCAVEAGGQSLPSREPEPSEGQGLLPAALQRPESDVTPARVVVGFGNPGEEHKDTPHNVGQRVLDRLARSLGVEWEQRRKALVAIADRKGTRLYLIKPLLYVNNTGPVLIELSREIGFGPGDLVLVQDDIDLPLGASRMRMRGSDGGHKGIRSVLEAFETDSIARVKIGVGRPGQRDGAAAHVVRPFSAEELAAIEAACVKAAEKVLELASRPAAAMVAPLPRGGTLVSAA
jgi:aminoacyl-tRNA hydrolase